MATDWKRFQDALHAWLVRSTGFRAGQIIFADQDATAPRTPAEDTLATGEVLLFGDLDTVVPNGTLVEAEGSGNAYELVQDGQINKPAEAWAAKTFYSRGDVAEGIDGSLFVALEEGTTSDGSGFTGDGLNAGGADPADRPTFVDGSVVWLLVSGAGAWGLAQVRAREGGAVSDPAERLVVIPEASAVVGWEAVWNSAGTSPGVSYPLTSDYIAVRLGGARRLGGHPGTKISWLGPAAPRNQEVLLKASSLAEFPVSVQCFTAAVQGNSAARAVLETAQASLQLPSFRDQINDAGLGLLEIGAVQVLNAVFGAAIEGRAAMDLRLSYVQTAEEKVGYIGSVTLEDTVAGNTFTIPKK